MKRICLVMVAMAAPWAFGQGVVNPMTAADTLGGSTRAEVIVAASNAAAAGAAAKYLPLAGGGRLDGTNYISNPTWYGAGGSGKEYGKLYVDSAGSMHLYAPNSGMDPNYLYLGGAYGDFGNVLAMDNYEAYFKRDVRVTNDLYVGREIYENGTALASKYASKASGDFVAIDTVILATNDLNYSIARKRSPGCNVTVTNINGMSTCGTGTWYLVQGTAFNSGWATSGTYSASTTGDTFTAAFTWTNGNSLFFVVDGAKCNGFGTNALMMSIIGSR